MTAASGLSSGTLRQTSCGSLLVSNNPFAPKASTSPTAPSIDALSSFSGFGFGSSPQLSDTTITPGLHNSVFVFSSGKKPIFVGLGSSTGHSSHFCNSTVDATTTQAFGASSTSAMGSTSSSGFGSFATGFGPSEITPPPPQTHYAYTERVGQAELKAAGIPRVFRRAMLSAPSSPTVGQETKLPLPALCLVSAFLPCFLAGTTAALTYVFCTDLPAVAASTPWRPPAMILGGVLPALVTVVLGYVHVFLPRAHWALREALVNVGLYSLGFPLWFAGFLVAIHGCTWMFIAMACLVAVLAATVLVFWLCLARVYGLGY